MSHCFGPEIGLFLVLRRFSFKGYGKTLINQVISNTLAAGVRTLDLNVNRYNNAKTFYEKMGFEVAYEEDIPIGKYWMNDFVMRKQL